MCVVRERKHTSPPLSQFGLTPLFEAIRIGDIEVFRALVKAGANVNHSNVRWECGVVGSRSPARPLCFR